eukprot:1389575-Amphidinium_carterae.1
MKDVELYSFTAHCKPVYCPGGGVSELSSTRWAMRKHCDVRHCQNIVNVKAVSFVIVDLGAIGSLDVHCHLGVHDCEWAVPLPATVTTNLHLRVVVCHIVVLIVPLVQRHCCIVVVLHPIVGCDMLWLDCLAVALQKLRQMVVKPLSSHHCRNATVMLFALRIVMAL